MRTHEGDMFGTGFITRNIAECTGTAIQMLFRGVNNQLGTGEQVGEHLRVGQNNGNSGASDEFEAKATDVSWRLPVEGYICTEAGM